MSWLRDNPFLAGIWAVCIVGAGALGYLIAGSVSAYSDSSKAYADSVEKLHKLQNKVPFPSEANLKSVQAGLLDYSSRIRNLQSQLATMQVPLDEKFTPQQFQDGLRTAVNDIRVKAETNGVKLPANFYFGFDQYQTQVPSEKAAPFLNRQFLVIQSLVARLVDYKVASVDGVSRVPLPQESAGPGQRRRDTGPVLSRFPFDISFTAEQPKFRVAFNSLLGSDQFLIVRSVGIQNSNAQAPGKKSPDAGGQGAANPLAAGAGGAPGKTQPNMQVIFGRELLKVSLRLEILDFAKPAAEKKSPP